jgi:hypothetical protein
MSTISKFDVSLQSHDDKRGKEKVIGGEKK